MQNTTHYLEQYADAQGILQDYNSLSTSQQVVIQNYIGASIRGKTPESPFVKDLVEYEANYDAPTNVTSTNDFVQQFGSDQLKNDWGLLSAECQQTVANQFFPPYQSGQAWNGSKQDLENIVTAVGKTQGCSIAPSPETGMIELIVILGVVGLVVYTLAK